MLLSILCQLKTFLTDSEDSTIFSLDFYNTLVYYTFVNTTGFPSPAQGYEDSSLNFNTLLIDNPATTFTLRYSGCGIPACGILCNDLMVVDCNEPPKLQSLVIVRTSDGFECHQITGFKSKVPVYTNNSGRDCPCKQIFGTVRAIIRLL